MKYRQIAPPERYAIAALRRHRLSVRQIARELGRAPSTISREIKRNACADGGYRPSKADSRTRGRRSRSRRNKRLAASQFVLAEQHLKKRWSPEQVAGRLGCMSHESIYVHVWRDKAAGGELWTFLRQAGKKRRKRYGAYDSRGRLAGKRHISERPAAAEARSELGHWEIDTIKGCDQARHTILTLVERKTGYLLLGKLECHTAAEAARVCVELIRRHPGCFKTITADNGTEFHSYRQIEAATGVEFYFATPHHSWERGTNENTNGLLRQYFPKRTSLAHVTQELCDEIADELNDRPRKRLAYRTPEECYGKAG